MPERNIRCPLFYRETHRLLSRRWKACLSPAEFLVCDMIFDRTFGWGKEWETISVPQFASGVTSQDGKTIFTHGTGLGVNTIRRALHLLVRRGAVLSEQIGHTSLRYCLNLDWQPSKQIMLRLSRREHKQTPTGLKTPRESGNVTENTTPNLGGGYSQNSEGVLPNLKCIEENGIEEVRITKATSDSAGGGFRGIMDRAKEKRERDLAEALATRTPTSTQCLNVWLAAYVEAFPDAPRMTWKQAEVHAIRRYCQQWQASGREETFCAYVWYCVTTWKLIRFKSFRRYTSAPEFPVIGFFVKMCASFETRFTNRDDDRLAARMTGRDRKVSLLVSQGLDEETAEREVDEKSGAARANAEADRKLAEAIQISERMRTGAGQTARDFAGPREAMPAPRPMPSGGDFPQWPSEE